MSRYSARSATRMSACDARADQHCPLGCSGHSASDIRREQAAETTARWMSCRLCDLLHPRLCTSRSRVINLVRRLQSSRSCRVIARHRFQFRCSRLQLAKLRTQHRNAELGREASTWGSLPIAATFNDRPRDCAVQMNFAARTCSAVKTCYGLRPPLPFVSGVSSPRRTQFGSRFLLRNSGIKLHLQQWNRLDRAASATRSPNLNSIRRGSRRIE